MGDRTYTNRSTSAGYRFPISSRPRSSDFHQTCVPQEARQAAQARKAPRAPNDTKPEADPAKSDPVTQDKIWKQVVRTEKMGVQQWEESWGFLTEFDPKGRPKTAKELPETLSMYSGDVPNTNSGNYGARVNTDIGRTMQKLEFQFHSNNRKKKLGTDMVCY